MAKGKNTLNQPRIQNILGWYGVLAILAAYALVSFKAIEAASLAYQLLNLTGALGIVIEAKAKKDTQPAALNAVWALVAMVAIIRIFIS